MPDALALFGSMMLRSTIKAAEKAKRVNKDVQDKLNDKDVLFRFPCLLGGTSTALVLKTPKTIAKNLWLWDSRY